MPYALPPSWRAQFWQGHCKMAAGVVMAVQVTIYLTEGDALHHRPLHLENTCAKKMFSEL
jgi:hypothetical protein